MDSPAERPPKTTPDDVPEPVTNPTVSLERRVRAIGETLERARFAGSSPRVELAASHDLDDAVARALAADRFGAPLVIAGQAHYLHEERAWDLLRSAQNSQRIFRFGEATSRLDR